jgi:hypothetical protein
VEPSNGWPGNVVGPARRAIPGEERGERIERRCRSLGRPPQRRAQGEVPERLNGRDWKSRDGGNFVRGFESLPLRQFETDRNRSIGERLVGAALCCGDRFSDHLDLIGGSTHKASGQQRCVGLGQLSSRDPHDCLPVAVVPFGRDVLEQPRFDGRFDLTRVSWSRWSGIRRRPISTACGCFRSSPSRSQGVPRRSG